MESTQLQAPEVSYEDVLTKIALRHPQAQVTEALKLAIAQEEARHQAALAEYQVAFDEYQAKLAAQPQDAEASIQEGEEGAQVEPLIEPVKPEIDLELRRRCYQVEHVFVDLALAETSQPARIEYDDETLIASHHPETIAHTAEEIATTLRARFKQEREEAISRLQVEVDGMQLDADEISQQRMARALLVMSEKENIDWVLANNQVVSLTKAQLFKACQLATQQQTALWVKS